MQHEVEFDVREHGDEQKNLVVYGSYGTNCSWDCFSLMLICPQESYLSLEPPS